MPATPREPTGGGVPTAGLSLGALDALGEVGAVEPGLSLGTDVPDGKAAVDAAAGVSLGAGMPGRFAAPISTPSCSATPGAAARSRSTTRA